MAAEYSATTEALATALGTRRRGAHRCDQERLVWKEVVTRNTSEIQLVVQRGESPPERAQPGHSEASLATFFGDEERRCVGARAREPRSGQPRKYERFRVPRGSVTLKLRRRPETDPLPAASEIQSRLRGDDFGGGLELIHARRRRGVSRRRLPRSRHPCHAAEALALSPEGPERSGGGALARLDRTGAEATSFALTTAVVERDMLRQ
jgi:hypothetical protein